MRFLFIEERKEIDVTRDLCRKYRVLDDCARLREVIETFPEDRHFITSVLFILWNEDDSETLPEDLGRMVCFPFAILCRELHSQRDTGCGL